MPVSQFTVLYDFVPKPNDTDGLHIIAGETVIVETESDDGCWYYGFRCSDDSGERGYFPKDYVVVSVLFF